MLNIEVLKKILCSGITISTVQVIEDLSQFFRRRKLLSQVQLVIGSVCIKRKILGKRSSSQLISADARVSGRSIGEHTDHLR